MLSTQRRILFITSSSLATNPRLIKNYVYYKSLGHKCKIVAFEYGNWTDELSQNLILKYGIDCDLIPASRKAIIPWAKAAIYGKLSKLVCRISPSRFWLAVASSKRTFQILKTLDKHEFNFDLIESHTLAALFPAALMSKKYGVPFIFDVEDYHPEEVIIDAGRQEKKRREKILRNHLDDAILVTAASPLIGKEIEKLLDWENGRVLAINNSFFAKEFEFINNSSNSKIVRFVWFSQNITYGRGLELFIKASKTYKQSLKLTLIGNLDQSFYNDWIKSNQDFIEVLPPINQADLHKELGSYDVGLVIELSSIDLNKDICLANKLFAYLQAGLFAFASRTSGHVYFFDKVYDNDSGILVGQTLDDFKLAIVDIINSINLIRQNRLKRFENGLKLSYETEVIKISKRLEIEEQ